MGAICEKKLTEVNCTIGQEIPFGKYYWRVLKIEDGKMLIISTKIIEARVYHGKYADVTWEDCDLRVYLNTTFINETFSPAEQERISLRKVWNREFWKESETEEFRKGNIGLYDKSDVDYTEDKIFLLSVEEVQTLFANNADRVATFNGEAHWWWLRSHGAVPAFAAGIYYDGEIMVFGRNVIDTCSGGGGVRPALFLNLSSDII